MADTEQNETQGTFKDQGPISMSEIRTFMNFRDGVNISESDISLDNLFSVASTNDISIPEGNYSQPHSFSELYSMSYLNNTPPEIDSSQLELIDGANGIDVQTFRDVRADRYPWWNR